MIALREIEAELETVRFDAPSSIKTVLPAVRELLDVEIAALYCPVEDASGYTLERFDITEHTLTKRIDRLVREFFMSAPPRYAWYDASRPEPAQRNKVIDAPIEMGPEQFQALPLYQSVIEPAGLHEHHQPRILICDGDSLLAWIGAFDRDAFDARKNALLDALAPSFRRRLRFERDAALATASRAVLTRVLDQIGAATLVVDPRGRIIEANAAGRGLFDQPATRREVINDHLLASLAGGPSPFELVRITDTGAPAMFLAILRTADTRVASALNRAAQRWNLTKRQSEVLELVVRGTGTATIAGELRITTRAVELHITKLFERAQVESRAALVAAVLA
ncbi:MAG: LuxR C-terminal-related transcriptional regulator [Kofleriaceae bacterium]